MSIFIFSESFFSELVKIYPSKKIETDGKKDKIPNVKAISGCVIFKICLNKTVIAINRKIYMKEFNSLSFIFFINELIKREFCTVQQIFKKLKKVF